MPDRQGIHGVSLPSAVVRNNGSGERRERSEPVIRPSSVLGRTPVSAVDACSIKWRYNRHDSWQARQVAGAWHEQHSVGPRATQLRAGDDPGSVPDGTARGSTRFLALRCAGRGQAPGGWSTWCPLVISLRRLLRTGERGGSGDGAAQANTRRCPEAGQRDQEIGRLPGCCAERKMVEARKRAWTGSQRSEDKGCTSGVLMRIPAQMTQRDGAGMAGERNTAGVHDGPRTDERRARAWVH